MPKRKNGVINCWLLYDIRPQETQWDTNVFSECHTLLICDNSVLFVYDIQIKTCNIRLIYND